MGGIDRTTGRIIDDSASIRQGIEVILTTPVGSRVMRRDFGVSYLGEDGAPVHDVSPDDVVEIAMAAIKAYEPRITVTSAAATQVDGQITSLVISYIVTKTSEKEDMTINYAVSA